MTVEDPSVDRAAAGSAEGPVIGRGRGWTRLLPALPAVLVLGVLFLGSMLFMLVYSFWRTVDFDLVPDWNLDNYARFVNSATYPRTFGKTLLMGAVVTIACLAMALPLAYFLVRYLPRSRQRIVLLAIIVPFWTSYLLRVYAWQSIMGETGAINQVLMGLGLLAEPSRLFAYNDIAVFVVLVYVYFPFAALALYASLDRFDFDQLRAAQDLGARFDQAFRYVLLPQIRPGIITASIFVFVPIIGEYLTPVLVGGAQGTLIANQVVNFLRAGQIPEGAAIAIVIAAFVTVLLIVFRRQLQVEDVVTRG